MRARICDRVVGDGKKKILIRQGIGRQSDSNIVGLDGNDSVHLSHDVSTVPVRWFGAINSPRKKC